MNQDERNILAKELINLALFYGKNDLTSLAVSQYLAVLDRFYNKSLQSYLSALDLYLNDGGNKYFPSPAQLKPYLEPKASSRDQALEIAQRCFGAIKKFGYNKPNEAKDYIGEVGWRLIQNRGGWYFHCTEIMERDIPNLTAQFRDTLQTYVNQGNLPDATFFDKARIEAPSDAMKQLVSKALKDL